MGAFCKVVDAALFVFFLAVSVVVPFIDGQMCLPHSLIPSFLLDLKTWYAKEYGDYLVSETPHFFVGIVWFELVFQWPLAVASVYGIASGKPWLSTTCLLYGASTLPSMVAILSELSLSNRASEQLLMIYYPFLGFALLALLRGLLANSSKNIGIGKRSLLPRKKGA